ncbi:MAG TPA: YajQ family cyclic di-GMP-binding protein [Gemmatimonadales bacterium]|nr:YajQ family cyclic di-GMP-binding protein [Gemmatimonadales bacterium]
MSDESSHLRHRLTLPTMASSASFDISTGADLQEVDNAVNQTLKEIGQRYDFKGSRCTVEFDRDKAAIRLAADDEFRMTALVDVLTSKLIRRGVPVKNLDLGTLEPASGGTVRRTVTLTQGIPAETAKKIVKAIKDQGFKKVQASIQGDEVRVSGPSRDELQAVIGFLRGQDFGIELKFGNYRS